MARLTLRLPESLHDAIADLADREGVSVNHFVVYALTQATAAELASRQRAQFDELRTRVPDNDAEAALASLLAERAADPDATPKPRRSKSPRANG